jgi:hypothetical protein
MGEYGKFWCPVCEAYFPDPLEDMHREAHAQERQPLPIAPFVLAGLAVGALILIFLIVRP